MIKNDKYLIAIAIVLGLIPILKIIVVACDKLPQKDLILISLILSGFATGFSACNLVYSLLKNKKEK